VNIEVCYAETNGATRVVVSLADGADVAEAVRASRIVETLALDPAQLSFAIFGRRATADARLVDGDRVELLRPLSFDPNTARHRRAAKKRLAGF
jgi:putative ubiquitin-RnfH superfamily antitoxin RatB of RatAB toxin-antitoxin module